MENEYPNYQDPQTNDERLLGLLCKQDHQLNTATKFLKEEKAKNAKIRELFSKFNTTPEDVISNIKSFTEFRTRLKVLAGFAPDDNITDDDLLDIIEDMIDA